MNQSLELFGQEILGLPGHLLKSTLSIYAGLTIVNFRGHSIDSIVNKFSLGNTCSYATTRGINQLYRIDIQNPLRGSVAENANRGDLTPSSSLCGESYKRETFLAQDWTLFKCIKLYVLKVMISWSILYKQVVKEQFIDI